MRAISLTQPWASLVVLGMKTFETRSWKTPYRGLLVIHAAKAMPKSAINLTVDEPFFSALAPMRPAVCDGSEDYAAVWGCPLGVLLGTVELVRIWVTEAIKYDAGQPETPQLVISQTGREEMWVSGREWAFGDYSPGRWAWELRNPKRFPEPIPCRGMLGVWTVPEGVLPDAEGRTEP